MRRRSAENPEEVVRPRLEDKLPVGLANRRNWSPRADCRDSGVDAA